ncbi:MAG: DNA-3-methyladenine glycosylase 2 family protein [Acidimicrobiales bacterium]
MTTTLDFDRCYRAVEIRDHRFDGWFITGVTSTGIYCRPSCPTPVRPKRQNVEFYPTAAAAQRAGFRACKRCRPDASPGSPEWDLRADLAGRAMRLIADGVIDRDGVSGLANQLAVSERNLTRILKTEVGASPIALARAQRAQTARILIETTDLPFTQVCFAAGFSSIRQFNDTVREVFALSPTMLRSKGAGGSGSTGNIAIRLAVRQPFSPTPLLEWMASHGAEGTVSVDDRVLRRTLSLPRGLGAATITPKSDHVWCELQLDDFADLSVAVSRIRRLLDLDADPHSVAERFASTPLEAIVAIDPGLRVPGAVDGFEQAVTTVLGQQVSVAAGRTFAGRLVANFGTEVDRFGDDLGYVFPDAETLAAVDTAPIGITGARQRTIAALAKSVVDEALDLSPGAEREATRNQLLALPGIGPWTADIIAMRALGDTDIFPLGDLVLRKAAVSFGLPEDPKQLAELAANWSPWRSYATHHLWATTSADRQRKAT